MINFHNKDSNNDSYDFETFKTDFNYDEKVAVIWILFSSATHNDRDASESELVQINTVANIIGLDAIDELFFEKASLGKSWIYNTVMSVISRKKAWFVVQLQALIGLDGIVKNERLLYNLEICEELGIDKAEYFFILQKAELFIKLNNL